MPVPLLPAIPLQITQATHDSTAPDSGDMLDKISDFVPGATGQKIEDVAKDKLGGFFGGNKTT